MLNKRAGDRKNGMYGRSAARSGYFAFAVDGLDTGMENTGGFIKKTVLTIAGVICLGGIVFGLLSGAERSREARIAAERNARLAAASSAPVSAPAPDAELPPALLDPNSTWGEYFVNKASSGDTPISDPSWNAFVASAIETYRRPDGKPSIIEKVLPKEVSSATAMDVFTLYSYIREVNPRVEANIALVEACSMLYYADRTNLPLSLVVGVSQTESNFRPSAVSSANARGVMQVMWKYHWAVLQANGIKEEKHLHDPELGVVAGTIVLSRYLKQEQSIPGALSRYYGILSNQYVGITLSHKHAFELYSSGISESWKNSMARERHFWNRMTGGREAVSAKSAPKVPGSNGKVGESVMVRVTPNPATVPSSLPAGSKPSVTVSSKKTPSAVANNGTIIVGASGGTVVGGSSSQRKGNHITVVYRNGERATWEE